MRSGLAGPCAVVLLSTVFVDAGASAQSAPARAATENNPLTAKMVKTGLFVISGETNSLLRLTGNGAIVVDGQETATYDGLMRHVRRLSERPVRVLITTDHHPERTASNAKFLERGTQIVAHENAAKRLRQREAAAAGLPTKTFDRELGVTFGGVEVQVLHFGPAHTDGDSVVYFPNLRVVAVGDLYAQTPAPDFSGGGSLVNWGTVLSHILKLDFDLVIPGRGPAVSRADLEALRSRIAAATARSAELVRSGVPKHQLMTKVQASDLPWRPAFTGADLDAFFAELSRTP